MSFKKKTFDELIAYLDEREGQAVESRLDPNSASKEDLESEQQSVFGENQPKPPEQVTSETEIEKFKRGLRGR